MNWLWEFSGWQRLNKIRWNEGRMRSKFKKKYFANTSLPRIAKEQKHFTNLPLVWKWGDHLAMVKYRGEVTNIMMINGWNLVVYLSLVCSNLIEFYFALITGFSGCIRKLEVNSQAVLLSEPSQGSGIIECVDQLCNLNPDCRNGATCLDDPSSDLMYQCLCPEGYTGIN